MIGGLSSGFKPQYYKSPDQWTHWWLYNKDKKEILDPTWDQVSNNSSFNYTLGINCGFLTGYNKISTKTQKLLNIIDIPLKNTYQIGF
jgi:hypothetical protein